MKRTILIIFVMLMLLSLVACGKSTEAKWQEQYDLGVRYLSDGNYEEAIIAFTAAIEIDPKRPEGYVGLADAYIGMGNYEMADDILQQGYEATGEETLLPDNIRGMESTADEESGNNEEGNNDKEKLFSNPLLWEEVVVAGLPFELCTVEHIAATFEGEYIEETEYITAGGLQFYERDNKKAMYLGPDCQSLEFRGISCGMTRDAVLQALGFTSEGIAFAEESRGSSYVIVEGQCLDAFIDTGMCGEGTGYDFALLLQYPLDSMFGCVLFAFSENVLMYVDIDVG